MDISPCVKRSLDSENTEVLKKIKTEDTPDVPKPAIKKTVFIQALSLKGDYVTIMNSGTDNVDLSDWKLESLGTRFLKMSLTFQLVTTKNIFSLIKLFLNQDVPLQFGLGKKPIKSTIRRTLFFGQKRTCGTTLETLPC
jgi:hypothetical protein